MANFFGRFFLIHMKKYFLVFTVLFSGIIIAQEKKAEEDISNEILDELLEVDEDFQSVLDSYLNFEFLYVSIDYNSNSYFSGRDIGIDQFNVRPQLSYFNSKGFFTSILGVYYQEFVPNWDYTNIAIGYSKSFKNVKNLRYSVSASHYIYAEGNTNPFKYAAGGMLSLKNKKRSIGTSISGTFLFGKDESFQFTSRTFASLNILKNNKHSLKLAPHVSLSIGKQTYELAQTRLVREEIITDYTLNNVFDLINIELAFPLQYNYKNLDIDLGFYVNLPSEIGDEINLKSTNYWNLSLGYIFDL